MEYFFFQMKKYSDVMFFLLSVPFVVIWSFM